VPPSQFASGGAEYFLIVGGGVLVVGILAPIALLVFRKPSWKTGEASTDAA
jgi:glutamate:GABA antiporter